MTGDAAVVFMADQSDSPEDVVHYWKKLNEGYDCVFGSRFIKDGTVIDYPKFKYLLNRVANKMVQIQPTLSKLTEKRLSKAANPCFLHTST